MEVQRDSPYSSDQEEEPNRPKQNSGSKLNLKSMNGVGKSKIGTGSSQISPLGNLPSTTRSNLSRDSQISPNQSFVKINGGGGMNTRRSNSGANQDTTRSPSSRKANATGQQNEVQQQEQSQYILIGEEKRWQSKEDSDAITKELLEKMQEIGIGENMLKSGGKNSAEDYLKLRVQFAEKLRKDFGSEKELGPTETQEFFRDYKMHSKDTFAIEGLHSSENLRLKRYKKSVYYGEVQNNSRTGKGIMVYSSGRAYEGLWQNDSKFGQGYELYPNGNVYIGFFVNGRPEGQGTYIWYNGEVYHGDWTNGMKHGFGSWMGAKGDQYIGEWKFGKADGKGIHKWVNGDLYQGEFKCCLKHGRGQERFSNGDIYVGQYMNGRPEGTGEYFWGDGAHYSGLFKNGLRHGVGIWKKRKDAKSSDVYEGEYVNDKRCGFGIFTWATGNVYKGDYFEDLRHGQGEMYWVDSSYYKGEWEKGIQCGHGELFTPNEGVKKGMFVNNIFRENGQMDESLLRGTQSETSRSRAQQNGGGNSGRRRYTQNSPVIEENSGAKSIGSGAKRFGNSPKAIKDFIENSNYGNDGGNRKLGDRSTSMPNRGGMGMKRKPTTSLGENAKGVGNGKAGKGGRSNSSFLPSLGNGGVNGNKQGGKKIGRKNREVLLKKHEILLWRNMKSKLGIKYKDLRDFTDEKTVEIIRNYLHPPIWKPSGIAHILESPQPPSPSRSNSPARSSSPNLSVNLSQYKKTPRKSPTSRDFSP